MVKTAAAAKLPERRLDLESVLRDLVADGLIRKDQPAALLARLGGVADPRHPLVIVAESHWDDARTPGRALALEPLVQWLAQKSGVPYLRIDPLSVEVAQATGVVSYAYAARAGILPIRLTPLELTVAVSDPYATGWERDLEPIVRRRIKRVLANPLDIHRYQVEFYALARSVKATEAERTRPIGGVQNLEQLMELGRTGKLDANDQHVVNIVDWLLQYAFDQRASDIHLEPRREMGHIRFRIDGVLHDVYQIPATVMAAVTSRLKILGRMDLAEKRRPQDGRIKTRSTLGREVELRLSSLPTAFGEKLVMRIFDPEVLVKDFAALGFGQDDIARWQDMIRAPHGVILVTGPTGSGKTTTLYSTLKQLATPDVNVCTIEDPIELVDGAFNQMQVQPQIELTFAAGVRALLRQDPDIIMVGEVRDLETAEIAVQAALTGHLVLSTLHTNDAPAAVTRLLDLGLPPYLLKATVLGILAQRLLRRLCPHCKRPIAIDDAPWQQLTRGWAVPRAGATYEAAGCLECRDTGFLGRVGIYEMMVLTPAVQELLTGELDLRRLRQVAQREGMVPLRIAGARKIAEGLTTLEEVMSATPDPVADR